MTRTGACVLACVLALGAAGPAAAGGNHFDIWLNAGKLSGDSTYAIGGKVTDNQGNFGNFGDRDHLSELKWPLDVVLASLGGRAEVGRFCVQGEIMKNATSNAGDMEDSDWGIYYDTYGPNPAPGFNFYPTTKDVYSTSKTDLSALILDVRGRYAVWQGSRFSTNLGLGLRYQRFTIVASDVFQYSPTFYSYGLDNVFPTDPFGYAGKGPALELSGLYRFGTMVSLEGSVGYSPLVQAKDRDDHLLRSKLSEGSDTGTAWLVDLKLRLQATEHWFGALGVSGLFINTSGTQTQSYYSGENVGYVAKIDQKITSSQTYGSVEVGFSF